MVLSYKLNKDYKLKTGKSAYKEKNNSMNEGSYVCRSCDSRLYAVADKLTHIHGRMVFDDCYKEAVGTKTDYSLGMKRVQLVCATCGQHLGHSNNGVHSIDSLNVEFIENTNLTETEIEKKYANNNKNSDPFKNLNAALNKYKPKTRKNENTKYCKNNNKINDNSNNS
eukprot:Pgem_evm1s18631